MDTRRIWLLLTGALVLGALVVGRQLAAKPHAPAESLLPVSPRRVQAVYERFGAVQVSFLRRGGEWVRGGSQGNATARVDPFLSALAGIPRRSVTSLGGQKQAFGLTRPQLVLTLTSVGGTHRTLLLGGPAPSGDGYYAALQGGREVFLVRPREADLLSSLARSP